MGFGTRQFKYNPLRLTTSRLFLSDFFLNSSQLSNRCSPLHDTHGHRFLGRIALLADS